MRRIRLDTLVGMAVSNLVAIAIMLATAATPCMSRARPTSPAPPMRPGPWSRPPGASPSLLFALGIIGTGLLSVPVLAGSAAYAVGECRKWKCGLAHKPWEALGLLWRDRRGHPAGGRHRLVAARPDEGAVLERGDQRRDRRADDGGDDAGGFAARPDGAVRGRARCARAGMDRHGGDGPGGGGHGALAAAAARLKRSGAEPPVTGTGSGPVPVEPMDPTPKDSAR
ncbi:divalent metal cation transporter [Caulobacter segnis]